MWLSPNSASFWRISPKTLPSLSLWNTTGILPILSSSAISAASGKRVARSAMAVPSVGWPANGSSSRGVKIRTSTPRSRSVAESRGKMKVVSERFVSRAMAAISASARPRASVKTASGLPLSFSEVNTSHWTNGYVRPAGLPVTAPPTLSAADAAMLSKNRRLAGSLMAAILSDLGSQPMRPARIVFLHPRKYSLSQKGNSSALWF